MAIFQKRLEEITSKNTDDEMLAKVESFQNRFIREKEVIDTLLHDIKIHEEKLSQHAKDHPVAIEHQYFENHTGLQDRMQRFVELWKELRNEFLPFVAKWM